MKHNTCSHFILENAAGKVIRSYRWDRKEIHLIRRTDTGRVEAHGELESLKLQGIPFQVLKSSSTENIGTSGVSIPKIGHLKLVTDQDSMEFSPSIVLEKEDETVIKRVFTWATLAHIALLLGFFIAYWIQASFFTPEEIVVKIQPQKIQKIATPKKTVAASKKKIDRSKKVGAKKTKKKTKAVAKKKPTKSLGALGALGGLASGKSGANGLKLKSALNNTGSGDSAGRKSLGKNTSALPGKGLFAQSGGNGKVNKGTVGYGTRGRAGGKAGYGSLNIGGSAGAYEHPLQEDGTAGGGLEMSQIEAVIRRNIGQIINCYEKGLQTNSGLKGRVAVDFVIGGQGRVTSRKVKQSSLKSASVEQCMLGKIAGWKFPKPHGNVDVKVSYPFRLQRSHQR